MFNIKKTCQNCRRCCQFNEDEIYFAPIFTQDEMNLIKSQGYFIDAFKPHKHSHDVFQIKLLAPKNVCPYLNENNHLCKIYDFRPPDCKIWPLVVMKDRAAQKTLLAYLNSLCPITNHMNNAAHKQYIKKLEAWFDDSNFIETYRKYPDLIWDYEPDTIIIKVLDT